jgi:hypothetical protein
VTSGGNSKMSREEELNKSMTILMLFLIALCLILVVLGGLLFSPGMLLVTVIRRVFSLSLDIGQMWVFSILSSFLIFGTFWSVLSAVSRYSTVKKDNPPSSVLALVLYLGLSLLIMILGLILYFGFHVTFPAQVLQSLFGWPTNI